jgi:FKBP-type peptidyl-prolyl cis-trans isomerase 2
MKKVETNSTVTVNYTGRLEDGSVFDSSFNEGREPLKATLGEGNLIKGFESGLIDMVVGDKKVVEISPSDAYGEYNNMMIQEVPKDKMPGEVTVGLHLEAQTDMGPVQFVVREVKEESVILDANHPLAGQKLIFELEVLDIQ